MAEQQPRLSAAFPPPPPFYEAFTSSRLTAYQAWIDTHVDSSGSDEKASLPVEFTQLRPPTPPTTGTYNLFGEQWPVVDEPFSLKDAGIDQLYGDTPNARRMDELKRLNHSLVFNFVELVDVLRRCPDQYPTKIDHFRLLLNNIYALINEYRPIQAKETLKLMLQDQIERKQAATRDLLEKCQSLTKMIEQVQLQAPTITVSSNANVSHSITTTDTFDSHQSLSSVEQQQLSDEPNTNHASMVPHQMNDPILNQKLYDIVMNIS
ncbi:MED7 protein-domain-containing protein [Syncephalis fuscata]|nr:MED7 protein-domain-containing protein [Syncephalis fuscata]